MKLNGHLSVWRSRALRMLDEAITAREGISPRKIIGDLRVLQRVEMGLPLSKRAASKDNFLIYYREQLGKYEARRQWGTLSAHRGAYRRLVSFAMASTGKQDLDFDQLTVELLEDFRTYLVSEFGNSVNTVNKNLRSIRAVLYQAIREERFEQSRNPFFRFQMKTKKGGRHSPLPIESI